MDKTGKPLSIKIKASTKEALEKVCLKENKSFGKIIDRELRRAFKLD
jgi:hypothetical protein